VAPSLSLSWRPLLLNAGGPRANSRIHWGNCGPVCSTSNVVSGTSDGHRRGRISNMRALLSRGSATQSEPSRTSRVDNDPDWNPAAPMF